MDQIRDWSRIEAEALFGNGGYKTGAGFEVRVVELSVALVLLEVGRILRRQKRALVMVKPPGNLWRTGILEIDYCVLVAIKLFLIKQGTGAMQQAGVDKLDIIANPFPVEAREERGGRSPIKTLIVIENPNFQAFPLQCR